MSDAAFTRGHDGHGLGLPLTRSLIAAHGGELTISSIQGQGTTVTISLPALRIVRPPASDRPAVTQASDARDLDRRTVTNAG